MGATIIQDLSNRLEKAVQKRKDEVIKLKDEKGIDVNEKDLPLDLSSGVRRKLKKLVNQKPPEPTQKQLNRYIRNKLKKKGYSKMHFKDGVLYTAEYQGKSLTETELEQVLKDL